MQTDSSWYFIQGAQQVGPLTWQQLVQAARIGALRSEDRVWSPFLRSWIPAGQVAGLFALPGQEQVQPVYPQQAKRQTPLLKIFLAVFFVGWVATALVFLFFALDLPNPLFFLVPPVSQTPTPSIPLGVPIGTFTIQPGGGQFSGEDLNLQAAAGVVKTTASFTIRRVDTKPPDAEYTTAYSGLYTIEGPLNQIQGALDLSLRVSPEILKDAPVGKGENVSPVTLFLEETVMAPSVGWVTTQVPLPSSYDAVRGLVRARLVAPARSGVGFTPQIGHVTAALWPGFSTWEKLAAPPQQTIISNARISIRYRTSYTTSYFESQHFLVWYFQAENIDPQVVELFLLELEDQYARIKQLGVSFVGLESKILVQIAHTSFHGMFSPSVWSESNCGLIFNSQYFKSSQAYREGLEDLRTTAGHELLHYVFFLYDPRWAATKTVDFVQRLWLEDAISTWYEPFTLPESERATFTPENLQSNTNHIRNPLFFPTDELQSRRNGYAASVFLRYLTLKFQDDALIQHIFEQVQTDDQPALNGGAALKNALALKQKDVSLAAEWPVFLEMRTFQSNRLFPDLSKYALDLFEKSATLRAQPLSDGNFEISFLANDKFQPVLVKGTLFQGPQPTLRAKFQLAGLSADGLEIRLAQDSGSQSFFQKMNKVLVSVRTGENCGVLVYGLPIDQSETPIILAGPKDALISKAGLRSELVIEMPPGKVGKLWFVAFNQDDTPTVAGKTPQEVEITFSFQIPPRPTASATPRALVSTPTPDFTNICSCVNTWLQKIYPPLIVKKCLEKGGKCVGSEVILLTPYRPDLSGQFNYCQGGYEAYNLFEVEPKRRLVERATHDSILITRAIEMCQEIK